MKRLILIGSTLLAMGTPAHAKYDTQYTYNPRSGQYEMIDVEVEADGDVETYNYSTNQWGYGEIDKHGEGYLYNYSGGMQRMEIDRSGDMYLWD